ncbi:oligosaccharide flippase family protein [Thalassotalea agariperforans]
MSIQKASLISISSKYISISLQLISSFIIARLLTPEEFGLFSIAIIFLGATNVIKDFGISNYIIKEQSLNQQKVSSAFTFSLMVSIALFLLLLITSTPIANFYDNSKLALIIQIIATTILISPATIVFSSILRKNLQFKQDLYSSLFAGITSVTTSITLAYNDYGVLSLALGMVAFSLTELVVIYYFRTREYSLKINFTEIPNILKYSKFVGLSSVVQYMSDNSADLAAGSVYSVETTGLLNRASSTTLIFSRLVTDGLSPILSPYFSMMKMTNVEKQKTYLRITSLFLCMALPFFLFLAYYSQEIITLMFGAQWLQSAEWLVYFCIGKAIFCMTQLVTPVLLGLGISKEIFWANTFMATIRLTFTLIGISISIEVMLILLCIVAPLIRTTIFIWLLNKHLHVAPVNFFNTILKEVAILVLIVAFSFICSLALPESDISYVFEWIIIMVIWFILNHKREIGLQLKKAF